MGTPRGSTTSAPDRHSARQALLITLLTLLALLVAVLLATTS